MVFGSRRNRKGENGSGVDVGGVVVVVRRRFSSQGSRRRFVEGGWTARGGDSAVGTATDGQWSEQPGEVFSSRGSNRPSVVRETV